MQVTFHECAAHVRLVVSRGTEQPGLQAVLHSLASRHGLHLHLGSSPQGRGTSIYFAVWLWSDVYGPSESPVTTCINSRCTDIFKTQKKIQNNNNKQLRDIRKKGSKSPPSRECWFYRPVPCTAARASPQ